MTRKKLTQAEIRAAFDAETIGELYPPILDVVQLANLLQLSKSTIYQWTSQGKLDFAMPVRGRKPRFWRDRIVSWFFGERGC